MKHECSKCGHIECVKSIRGAILDHLREHGASSPRAVSEALGNLFERESVENTLMQLRKEKLVTSKRGHDLPKTRVLYQIVDDSTDTPT